MISYSNFVKSCQFLIKNDERSEGSWEEAVINNNRRDHEYYLVKKKCYLNIPSKYITTDMENENPLKDMEYTVPEDPLCLETEPIETYIAEFHIVYSVGFQVPVLYFNIWDRLGKLLSLVEVWEILSYLNPAILDEKWKTVTQGEHPLESKPFYYFHPCNTESAMQFMKSGHSEEVKYVENYIPSWLNIYGSMLGLSVFSENIFVKS